MKNIEMINASAGSGKTYRLTEKVLEKLKTGLMPEALMATTFTKKAAAELRERIRMQLLRDNKYEEAQRVYDGFIGTVNSICARLLKEYALDAGLSPALEVLPEEDSERLFNIAISAVIDKHAPAIDIAAQRLELDGSVSGYQKKGDWRDDVRNIVEKARSNRIDAKALRQSCDSSLQSLLELFDTPPTRDFDGQLSDAVDTAITELNTIVLPKKGTQGALELLKKYQSYKKRGLPIPWSLWVRLYKQSTNKDGRGMLDNVKLIASDLFKHPVFHSDIAQVIKGVFDCAIESLSAYEGFKLKQGLMDFVDQETKVLDLARNNKAFQKSMSTRLQQLMVDEFQDTSPIQLALFVELHKLAGRSVWVGDPKQVIYGFRGADPKLIEEVSKKVSATEILSHSWRSRKELVEFCNHVFTSVFHELGEEKVKLDIPEARAEEAVGGWLESWNLTVGNKSQDAGAIARGVQELLERQPDLRPGDIAVLCRTNDTCRSIAENLEAIGIHASAAQGGLLQTRECRLALAALRYLQDGRDSVALAEIVHLSPFHPAQGSWLDSLMETPKDTVSEWKEAPLIKALYGARDGLKYHTPLEVLEIAIDKIRLVETIKAWGKTKRRRGNLDAMRGACIAYIDRSRARRSSATVTGFISYVQNMELQQAQGLGEKTVQVLSYHKAKGLEWPIVIMAELDAPDRASAFGVHVVPAKRFNPEEPLANRSIRYWPWPFGAQRSIPILEEKLESSEELLMARTQAKKEANRLMYVGMTRAKDGLVFAVRKKETKTDTYIKASYLDQLTDAKGCKLIDLPLEEGDHKITIAGHKVSIKVRDLTEADGENISDTAGSDCSFQATGLSNTTEHPNARIYPTSVQWSEDKLSAVSVDQKAGLGGRLPIKGAPAMENLGNAIHGFLGADQLDATKESRLTMAEGLLERWGVSQSFSPEDMLTASDRLNKFIKDYYPTAGTLREWPISLRNDRNQLMQGWIDLLLELPDGYVVIDHKSYPGTDAAEHIRQYAPQLAVYKEAVEKATGKPVLEELIHLPIIGRVYGLHADR